MDDKITRLLFLTDRVVLHVEHQIPPEAEVITELRKLIDELQRERVRAGQVDSAIPGTT